MRIYFSNYIKQTQNSIVMATKYDNQAKWINYCYMLKCNCILQTFDQCICCSWWKNNYTYSKYGRRCGGAIISRQTCTQRKISNRVLMERLKSTRNKVSKPCAITRVIIILPHSVLQHSDTLLQSKYFHWQPLIPSLSSSPRPVLQPHFIHYWSYLI